MYAFRVSHNAISLLIRNVCEAIIEIYAEEVIACPVTPDEWKTIADGFGVRWQLHHCLGALYGKHIAIKCPKNGGSLYYNHKGFYSVILLALVDAHYKFVWIRKNNDIVGGNRLTCAAKAQKEYLKAYYNSEAGVVPWQGNMI
ncbi:uncharacterized protein LOC134283800 [Saccostrea cucullata]|uniref:uncharacterized protein LOC134283800 n=1 Tax=Saccostrea cuccullata TaxID=36930 RepID=UPI002ED1F585